MPNPIRLQQFLSISWGEATRKWQEDNSPPPRPVPLSAWILSKHRTINLSLTLVRRKSVHAVPRYAFPFVQFALYKPLYYYFYNTNPTICTDGYRHGGNRSLVSSNLVPDIPKATRCSTVWKKWHTILSFFIAVYSPQPLAEKGKPFHPESKYSTNHQQPGSSGHESMTSFLRVWRKNE